MKSFFTSPALIVFNVMMLLNILLTLLLQLFL